MRPSSENNPSKPSKTSQVSDQEIMKMSELAECMLDVLKNEIQKDSEPFEHYAQEVRLRLFQDVKLFRDRFAQGYEALLETLSSISKKNN